MTDAIFFQPGGICSGPAFSVESASLKSLIACWKRICSLVGGVRTLASSELAYQPMDYQLGSVWPHDSGFCAVNAEQCGANHAHSIMRGLFDAAKQSPDYRLPELFCGFERGVPPLLCAIRLRVFLKHGRQVAGCT